jgi:hypothetical protein
MTTPTLAKKCFGLMGNQIKQIPIMYSIPGTYGVRFRVERRRVYRLVSVKHAKQLGIEVYRSADDLAKLMPRTPAGKITLRRFWIFKHFHQAPLEAPGCDLSKQPEKSNLVEDDFGGMVSVRFPYLTEAGVDYGRICRGCRVVYYIWRQGSLRATILSELVPPDLDPFRTLYAMMARL